MKKIQSWLNEIKSKANFSTEFIPYSKSKEWIFDKKTVSHKTGGFFKIIGVKWNSLYQPLIDQREIGTLGFFIYKNRGKTELLVQAKIEPGNVGVIQLAPTYQATASNTFRLHGGKTTPFKSLFINPKNTIIYESLQSEQGTRFYQKQNKNILIEAKNKPIQSFFYKWFEVDELLNLLKKDFLVNTDARSVLVCSPWKMLVSRKPFTRFKYDLSKDFQQSYLIPVDKIKIDQLIKLIFNKRSLTPFPQIVPLDQLENWKITRSEIKKVKDESFSVKQVKVKTKGREVPEWDQPIVISKKNQYICLISKYINNVLKFGFSLQVEPGLYNLIELGPTYLSDNKSKLKGKIIIETNQSEEGGRFYYNINNYKIIMVGNGFFPKNLIWLTLSEIQYLLLLDGMFTNEARSIISLLLTFL